MKIRITFLLLFISSLVFAQTTYYSRISGLWNDPNTWSTNSCGVVGNAGTYPQGTDIVFICHTVQINLNAACQNITINSGGILEYDAVAARSLTLSGAITVNAGGTFRYAGNNTLAHNFLVTGNFENNGAVDFYRDANDHVTVSFIGALTSVVIGTGTWDMYSVVLNKSSKSDALEVTATAFYTNNFNTGTWNLIQGTYFHNNTATLGLGGAANFTINQNCAVRVGAGIINFATAASSLTLQGRLELLGGTVNVGSTGGAAPFGILYESVTAIVPQLIIQGGNLNVFQGIHYKTSATDPFQYTQFNGAVRLNFGASPAVTSTFQINDVASSLFNMAGGTITIVRMNFGGFSDFSLCGINGAVSSTGGTVIFGDNTSSGGQTYNFTPFANATLPSFRVSGVAGNTMTLKPFTVGDFRIRSLYIETNKYFDMSHNGNASDNRTMTIAATYDGVHSFWDNHAEAAHHFLYRTSTVVFEGSSTIKVNGGSFAYLARFFNIQCAQAGFTTTIEETMGVENQLRLLGGTLTSVSWQQVYLHAIDPLSFNAGSIISVESVKFFRSGGSQNIVGYDYDTKLVMAGDACTYAMQGDVQCNYLYVNGDFNTGRSATFIPGNHTLEVMNDLEVGTTGGTNFLKIFYAGTSAITVHGNFFLFQDAEYYGQSSAMYLAGNWTNTALNAANRGYNENTSTVIFTGGNASLSCTNFPEVFYDIQVDKTLGNLTLAAPMNLSHQCTFANGKIIANSSNPFTFLFGSSHVNAGVNGSFIEGPTRMVGTGTIVFPIGSGTYYRPATIYSIISGNNTDIHRAEYFPTSPNGTYPVAQRDGILSGVSTCEYWSLTRELGTASGRVRLAYNTVGSCNTSSFGSMSVARWNGSLWNDLGGTGGAGRMGDATAGSVESSINNAFNGPFTLGIETTPTITPSGPTTFCTGSSITLTASSGSSYLWSTSETTQSITVSAAGSYTVTVGPSGATSAATVITTTSAPAAPTASNVNICSGGSGTLTASGSPSSYNWYDASSGGTLLGSGATYTTPLFIGTTTYYVTSVDGSCESMTRTPATVFVFNKPTLHTSASPVYSCGDAQLTAYTDGLGNCISLDGTDDHLSFPAGTYFTGDYTIEAWVRPRSHNNWQRIVDFGNGLNADNIIVAASNGVTGRTNFTTYKGAASRTLTVSLGDQLLLNEWTHVAVTMKDSTGTIYLNGIQIASGLMYPAQGIVLNLNYIGRSNDAAHQYFNGDMDELRIWNTARTQAQLSSNMLNSVPNSSPNLIAYLKMNEGTGPTTNDEINPLDPQLWGGATWNTFNGPIDVNYAWTPAAGLSSTTGRTVVAAPAGPTVYTVTATYSSGCTNNANISVLTAIPGDTSNFGNNTWNVYAYKTQTWNNYAGYYTSATLDFTSSLHFNTLLSPSKAAGYQGCEVGNDYFSVRAKRTGFTSNIYQLNVVNNDDSCKLYINDKLSFERTISSTNVAVWTGLLNASSKVDFRFNEFIGSARGTLTFTVVTQPTLTAGSISGDQSFCLSGDPVALNSGGPASGCTIRGYQWQHSLDNVVWTDVVGQTGLTYDPPTLSQSHWYRRQVTDECNAVAYTNTVLVEILTIPGDTSEFGFDIWNVYAFGNRNFTNYRGYYSSSALNFNTTIQYTPSLSPSIAATYLGCSVPNDNFSLFAKRTQFTDAIYEIHVMVNDDSCFLFVDDRLWLERATSGSSVLAWVGRLRDTSEVEIRLTDVTGDSRGIINFVPISQPPLSGGSISGAQTFCTTGDPVLLNSNSPATGCTLSGYQWQDSISSGVWTNIIGATALTFDPPTLSETTWYRRQVADECGDTAYSNTVRIEVHEITGDTAVYGDNTWIVYGFSSTNFTNYRGFYTDANLNMDSDDSWGHTQSPSDAIGYTGCSIPSDNFSMKAKRKNFAPGYYNVSIANDDSMYFYVNGILRFRNNTASSQIRWTGYLDENSEVEFRLIEFAANSYLDLNFAPIAQPVLNPGSIGNSQSFCFSGNPTAFTSVTPATTVCTLSYQWQDSTAGGSWVDIIGATAATFDEGVISDSTWYRRKATDDCNNEEYTNEVSVYIRNPAVPVYTGAPSFCRNTTAQLTMASSSPFLRWYTESSGGSPFMAAAPGVAYSVTATVDDTFYVSAYDGFCESARGMAILNIAGTAPIVSFSSPEFCGTDRIIPSVNGSGSALLLDGTDDHVMVPAGVYFSGDFTIEGWVKLDQFGSWQRLVDFGNGANDNNVVVSLDGNNDQKVVLLVFNGNQYTMLSSASGTGPYLNEWMHIACVLQGTTASIYVNGELSNSGPMFVPTNVMRNSNYIGQSNFVGNEYPKGLFDEIRIWNVARTPAEIQTGMNASVATNAAGLQNYWKCDEGNGTVLTDATSAANGTLQNGTSWAAYGAPLGYTYSWMPSANLTSPTSLITRTAGIATPTLYKLVVDNSGCKDSATVQINQNPTGDTSIYGINEWRVYSFEGSDFDAYHGFFTQSDLNYNSENSYDQFTESPSNAGSYLGCPISIDYHSTLVRRTGFTEDVYTLNVLGHDDYLRVRKDNDTLLHHYDCCDSHNNLWVGKLFPSSKLDFQLREKLGNTNLSITLIPTIAPPLNGGIISAAQTQCAGVAPDTLRNVTLANGCSGIEYQWEDSSATLGWTPIANATLQYYVPGIITETTKFRRSTTDACDRTSYSNTIEITIQVPAQPTAEDVGLCTPGSATLLATGAISANHYRWYDAGVGGIQLSATEEYITPVISTTTAYYVAAVSALGCIGPRDTVVVIVPAVPPGDTSEFGIYEWNAYVFEGANFDAYRGFYISATLDIDTDVEWDQYSSPSTATGYEGCTVGVDNFSIRFKRRGFSAENYRIDIPDHDDQYKLFVNGVLVSEHSGFADAHYPAWVGSLDANSTIEIQLQENLVASYLQVRFTITPVPTTVPKAGLISSAQSFCTSGNASTLVDGRVLYPTKDATVHDGNPTTNYGIDTLMRCHSGLVLGSIRFSFITFDLGTSPEPIQTAMLALYGRTVGSEEEHIVGAYPLNDTTWNESTITYNNYPAFPNTPIDTVRFGKTYGWEFINVASYLESQRLAGRRYVSFAVRMTYFSASNRVDIHTREYTYPPSLQINKSYSPCFFHYKWLESPGCTNVWTPIANADTAIYTPGTLTETTCFRKVITDDCGRRDSSNIVIIAIDSLTVPGNISGTSPVCENLNSGTLSLASHRGDVVEWLSSADNATFTPIANTTSSLSFSNLSDTTWYRAVVKNKTCPEDTSTSFEVQTTRMSAGGTIFQDTSVCQGGTATLQLLSNIGSVVRWESSVDNFTNATVIANTAVVHAQPVSVVTQFRAVVQNGGCPAVNSASAQVSMLPPPSFVTGPEHRVIIGANNDWVKITGNVDPVVRWEVSTDSTVYAPIAVNIDSVEFINVMVNTWYRAVLQSPSCGEHATGTIKVSVFNPLLFSVPDTILVYRDELYVSSESLLDRISYQDNFTVGALPGTTPTALLGTFQITANAYFNYQPPSGYLGLDSVNFSICANNLTMTYCEVQPVYFEVVEPPPGPGPLVVYSSFSPNGDGSNDSWVIENIQFFPNNAVRILDRWGRMVFEQQGYDNEAVVWKGEAKSKGLLPEDTYYYILEVDDKIAKTGYVVIKR